MFAGVVRAVLAVSIGLSLGLVAGCDSCGDDDDSGGATGDDDNDDASPAADDDNDDDVSPDDDDDDNDDATPFCADGYLTPAGDCLTQIDGGDPGHNGVSAAVAPDGTVYVAAARGRQLVLYFLPVDKAEWQEEIVDYMAGSPVIAFDGDGGLHLVFRDRWNRELRYGVKTAGLWALEDVGFDGAYVDLAVDHLGRPHLSYQNPDQKMIGYARREDSGWVLETPLDQTETGYITDIAVDRQAHAHIAFGAVGGLLGASYYATNAAGYWQTELVEVDTYCPRLDVGADDIVHYVYSRLLGIEGQGILMHRYGSVGAWQTEEVDPTPFYNGLHDLNVRVDEALRPHVFYTGARLPIQMKLNHAVKDGADWQTETVAADPYDDIDYRYVTAYQAAADDFSVARQTSPDGLQFYGPGPAYRPTTLGKGVVSDFDYFCDADGDERYFYKIADRRLVYRRVGASASEEHDIETEYYVLRVRMAIDPLGHTHLYYAESPESGVHLHRYLRKAQGIWTTATLPLDESAYLYPVLAADANSAPHFFLSDAGVLQQLWEDGGFWSEEVIDDGVAIPMAAAVSPTSVLHVLYFNEQSNELRHASKSPEDLWIVQAVDSVWAGTVTQVGLTLDPASGTIGGCYTLQDPAAVVYVSPAAAGWGAESLFSTYGGASLWDCGVGVHDDASAAVAALSAVGLLLAVRADGQWVERVMDSSGGAGVSNLYWDQSNDLRIGYRAQSSMQRAVIPAQLHEEGIQ